MLISLKWLKKYVDIPINMKPEDLASKITMSILEVEDIIQQDENLDNIVVGKIIDISDHPDANKLKVVQVDVGKYGILKVVCGGNNLRKDMTVPVALIGSRVKWHGQGELVTIEKTKIRGIESEGMIAAAEEIGLPSKYNIEGGIADLSLDESFIGMNIKEALNLDDVIFDIDNKSLTNRPDLWGHIGIAREISALLNVKFKSFNINEKIIEPIDKSCNFSVEILSKEACPRYTGIVVKNIKVAKSPDWLVRDLESVGMRSVNNIVDITNFVMMDLGQPMHAFDLSKIKESKIIVRYAKDKEKFTTLDDQKIILSKTDLLICDNEKPLAIAGIMGGKNSEIINSTTCIFLESANFDATTIRKTSGRLGLRTDSSSRFEKSLDPNITKEALLRAVELIKQLELTSFTCGKIIDENNSKRIIPIINISLDLIYRRIGKTIALKDIVNILERLNFDVKTKKNELEVTVPSYRAGKDVTIQEDLIEEIARIYCYENIEPAMPFIRLKSNTIDPMVSYERRLKNFVFHDLAYNEVSNYSMISEEDIKKLGSKTEDYIEILNAVSKNIKFLRNSLSLNLLKNVSDNLRYFKNFKLFEVGRIFKKDKGDFKANKEGKDFLPFQDKYFAIASTGNKNGYFDVKGDFEILLEQFNIRFKAVVAINNLTKDGTMLEYFVDDQSIGFLGELKEDILNNFDIKEKVYYAELNMSKSLKYIKDKKAYKPLPKYPSMTQDISMLISSSVLWENIESSIHSISSLIEDIQVFDVYEGENIEKGKKSIAFHIIFHDPKRTLVSKEVEDAMRAIKKMLTDSFKVKIREQ